MLLLLLAVVGRTIHVRGGAQLSRCWVAGRAATTRSTRVAGFGRETPQVIDQVCLSAAGYAFAISPSSTTEASVGAYPRVCFHCASQAMGRSGRFAFNSPSVPSGSNPRIRGHMTKSTSEFLLRSPVFNCAICRNKRGYGEGHSRTCPGV